MKADRGRSDPMGRAIGCSLLVACVVFSGTEAVPEEVKHEGDVTEDGRGAIGFGTGTGGESDGTGVTRSDTEAGTVKDTGDETPRESDGELIGCGGKAPT